VCIVGSEEIDANGVRRTKTEQTSTINATITKPKTTKKTEATQ
jgi:carbohydrate-binding DOMON domain-containing protein